MKQRRTDGKPKYYRGEWRGFASMPVEQHRAIARMGNAALRQQGDVHVFSREEAVVYGRKGGKKKKPTTKGSANDEPRDRRRLQ